MADRMTNLPYMVRWLVFILPLVLAPSAAAEVFKSVEPDGTISYSDRPTPEAQTVKILEEPPPPASSAPSRSAPKKKSPKPSFPGYTQVTIESPPNDETVWDNTGNVSVHVALKPPLETKLGHKLVLFLDSKQVAESNSASAFELINLDRGTYTLRAAVVDQKGKEIAGSGASVFHLKKYSKLFKKPKGG